MTRTVFGVFKTRSEAEDAISDLKADDYNPKEISVIMRDQNEREEVTRDTGAGDALGNTSAGAVSGGVIGGIAGLLVGIGTIAIPGIGAILIGGPVAAALGLSGAAATTVSGAVTGALAGGLVGALTSLGVSEDEARTYEERVKGGAILLAVPARNGEEDQVISLFEDNGATDVTTANINNSERDNMTIRNRTDNHDGHHKVVNPIQVEKKLKDVKYPASKEKLISTAQDEGADDDILYTLEQLPNKKYQSPKEISQAIGHLR